MAEAEATAERQQSFQRRVQQARAPIHVAAGALCRPGWVLLGQRAPRGVLGGLWEFPGGKVEEGESLHDALKRELQEELGVAVDGIPIHLVAHRTVGDDGQEYVVHVFGVKQWSNEPWSREGQALQWSTPSAAAALPCTPSTYEALATLTAMVSGTGGPPLTWSGHPQGHGGTHAVRAPPPRLSAIPADITEVAWEAFLASPPIFASWLQTFEPRSLEVERQPVVGPSSSAPLTQEVIENLGFVPAWAGSKAAPMPEAKPPPKKARRTSGKFTPTWARQAVGEPAAGSPPRGGGTNDGPAGKETDNGFRPAWALNRQAGHRRGTTRGTDRGGTNHPYERPAYGQSRLRPDQQLSAARLARRLANDRTPGRIHASQEQLLDMATAVAEARADGINPRTGSKDAFALREFEAYARIAGFDPNLQTEWARRFPERENLKLASWLLWRAQRAVPRSRKGVAKPMSIYQNYLALRRVFKSRDVELPAPGTVRETLRGLIKRFIRRFGIEALRPKRVEPVTPAIVMKCLEMAREGGTFIKGHDWSLSNWTCFIVTAWMW